MSTTAGEFHLAWKQDLQKIRAVSPETALAFGSFHQALMKSGALSIRDKELIALSIGVSKGCEECIFLHTEAAINAGATRGDVIEAAGVAIMMEGGPGFVHFPAVLAALEFAATKPS